jgi:hypothetical protein
MLLLLLCYCWCMLLLCMLLLCYLLVHVAGGRSCCKLARLNCGAAQPGPQNSLRGRPRQTELFLRD